MANYIKSGTTTLTSVVRGNVYVGIEGVSEYGPTSNTGFYNGITPPNGGYTIYVLKASQGPSIHVANNDSQCIFFLKSFGATGTTISDVLSWANLQTNLWVTSSDLTSSDLLVTSGLVLRLDASNSSSYPGTSNVWYDLAGSQDNITLVDSVSYTSGTPSYFSFNGTNQRGGGSSTVLPQTGYTKSVWFYLNATADNNLVSSDLGGHFMYFSGTNKLYNGHSNWSNFLAFPSVTTFSLNTWYCATLTFNTTDGMKLYVNGVLDSTYTANKSALPGNGYVNIAAYGVGNLLNGRISKVYCYNRSISDSEVLQIYNYDKSHFGF